MFTLGVKLDIRRTASLSPRREHMIMTKTLSKKLLCANLPERGTTEPNDAKYTSFNVTAVCLPAKLTKLLAIGESMIFSPAQLLSLMHH